MALNKDWKDLPSSLAPQAGETLANWHARIDAYAVSNPSALTPLGAVALEDLETRAQAAIVADRVTSKTVLTRNADGTVATATDNLGRVTDQIVRGAAGITGFREAGVSRTVVRDANGRIMEVT
jgi:hypothetical protein